MNIPRKKGNIWLRILAGSATGAITALLHSSKPGTKMRHGIKAKAKEAGKKAGEACHDAKEGDKTQKIIEISEKTAIIVIGFAKTIKALKKKDNK